MLYTSVVMILLGSHWTTVKCSEMQEMHEWQPWHMYMSDCSDGHSEVQSIINDNQLDGWGYNGQRPVSLPRTWPKDYFDTVWYVW